MSTRTTKSKARAKRPPWILWAVHTQGKIFYFGYHTKEQAALDTQDRSPFNVEGTVRAYKVVPRSEEPIRPIKSSRIQWALFTHKGKFFHEGYATRQEAEGDAFGPVFRPAFTVRAYRLLRKSEEP